MKIINFTILLLLLLFMRCKKAEIIEPVKESPVFAAEFTLGGQNILLEAGRNSFYQYANYFLDTNDVYVFKSLLAKDSFCTSQCQESLQINIRSNTPSNGQLPNLAQALKVGNYLFAQANDTLTTEYQYKFTGNVIGTNQTLQKTYAWHFSSEVDTSALDLSAEKVTITMPDNVSFQVKLDVVDAYGATGSKLMHFSPNSFAGITMNISGNASAPVVMASLDPFSNSIDTLTWSSGFTGPDQPLSPSHPYGTYCVSGDDIYGNFASSCGQYVSLFGQNIFCTAQINWTKEEIVHYDHQWLSAINITYIDQQGVKWTSFDAPQPNSEFEITHISDYGENELGIPTKIITANFSMNITNGSQTKLMTGSSTFSVGIPQ